MPANEPKVEITLKEVYDKVLETHTAVTGIGPRLTAVEDISKNALSIAQQADTRSKENRRYLKWIGNGLLTILTGGIVVTIGAWMTGHIK